ncbi:hypothetical protein BGX38DRAFT_1151553 [Terfezia claveryi]|nr:hypothetical protein BGX38DRAFT_1151553 [Terfezia claveryi]
MSSEETEQSVHIADISDDGCVDFNQSNVDCEFEALGGMERLTLEDEPETSQDTEMVDPISFPGHGPTAIFSSGPSNHQCHPSQASERFSSLASWVTTPGSTSTLTFTSTPTQSVTTTPVEVGSAGPSLGVNRDMNSRLSIGTNPTDSTLAYGSNELHPAFGSGILAWVTTPGSTSTLTFTSTPTQSVTTTPVEVGSAGPSLGVNRDMNSRLSIGTNPTDSTLAYGSNELHPAFGSGILAITSTLKKRPRARYVPKLQIADDVFLTRDIAHAKRLRQNYILAAPRLKGYRGCQATAACCSCRLRIEDFEQSPTAKRFRFTHMNDARVGYSQRHCL